jgi:hydroxymethylpyrimidine/phosphomethylpyrimidine kinase
MVVRPTVPVVLTIAGSDSSAGAGIQADLKAIAAQGAYGVCALTSVVSEMPGKVSKVRLLDTEIIEDQARVLLKGFPIAAAKTGMLGGAQQVQCVARVWRELGQGRPLVVDPVMVATGGGRLLTEDAVQAVMEELLPLATLITPNMDEASVLWGHAVGTEADLLRCAHDLAARWQVAVLVKGGHLSGEASDVLVLQGEARWFRARRVAGVHTHGTGCSFSAAIAAQLALGKKLHVAVDEAKRWLTQSLVNHLEWSLPDGVVHAINHLDQR